MLLIDADCKVCQRSRSFLQRRAVPDHFDVVPLDSEAGHAWLQWCGRDPADTSTVVLATLGGCTVRSTAILQALGSTDRVGRALAVGRFVPRPVRDVVYRLVSYNRHMVPVSMPGAAEHGLLHTVAEGRRRAEARGR